jgi:transcriptional regulator with XRE-family HTH domain
MLAENVPMAGLKVWRERHRLTLEELGDLIGYTRSHLSRVERGERALSAEAKVRVARRLGVPIRELFPIQDSD